MESVAARFIREILEEITRKDPFHARTLIKGMEELKGKEYARLINMIFNYFNKQGLSAREVSEDYLKMIADMRREMKYFSIYGEYSCKNQEEAYNKVYSNPEVMGYYMNALILTNLLWSHHFEMFDYFSVIIKHLPIKSAHKRVLDVGSGHGLYIDAVRRSNGNSKIDILDISASSLKVIKEMIGGEGLNFIQSDILEYDSKDKYDFIILGEILEHMDNPLELLKKAEELLHEDGLMWISVPTNAPAIDHVYLFKNEKEVLDLIALAGFYVYLREIITIEGTTQLIGIFCGKNEIETNSGDK